jgi:hypothetical protein
VNLPVTDPQDAEDVTEREIQRRAAELAVDACNRDWLDALRDGLARYCDPGPNYPRENSLERWKAMRLHHLREAVYASDAAEVLEIISLALAEEWRARAEEDLCG